jgi:hypothetical protein
MPAKAVKTAIIGVTPSVPFDTDGTDGVMTAAQVVHELEGRVRHPVAGQLSRRCRRSARLDLPTQDAAGE